ncbi:hypothetical protein [Pseudomonas sp. 18173]|uniref:hypothetical protein n=1 Tax=Pseudomonas sp. 18173 TaxID=3390055 RepID=UPI003D25928D
MNLKTCLPKWLGLLAALAVPSAGAMTQEIRAVFTPDPANPQRNAFVNVTPVSGRCVNNPGDCRAENMSSIRLPIKFQSARAMQPNDPVVRNRAMFKIPAQWRSLTVTNADTGKSETVEVRVAGIASQYRLSDTAQNLTGESNLQLAHARLWDGRWDNAPSPCTYSTGAGLGADYYYFVWRTPVEGTCVRYAQFPIPGVSYEYLDFIYQLRTPNPLGMSSGLYTGSLNYSFGPGGDYDMGDVMLPDDPVLTLDFVLDVQHALKVDIPPGGEKIQLVPEGGWQNWLQAGRKPVRVFRDQTFNISASTRFKMRLECEFIYVAHCMLRDSVSNRTVQVFTRISLPNGLTWSGGQPIQRHLLRSDFGVPPTVYPGFYVDRAPGVLHFEIPGFYFKPMLGPGEGGRFRGNVTVIWDSEV